MDALGLLQQQIDELKKRVAEMMAEKPRQKTYWFSRDIKGEDADKVCLWTRKPKLEDGVYDNGDTVVSYTPHCPEYKPFSSIMPFLNLKRGQLVKLTIWIELSAAGLCV
jgi:hypothetical protein